MATLALSAGGALLGGAVGGSVGASVGWALGGLAGAMLFPQGGKDTTGPRLSDLSVQSAAYGTGIPVIYGTTRVSGNIIWSSGLREAANRRRQGGKGGGRPTSTTYSYSSSWAVGLCEGPAVAVRRIWFDDKLVFDSSGNSVQIEIPGLVWRFHAGDETQLPDPLIEAAVGSDNATAHRGLCYVVFDDVPLERLNNRIPNCSFEIVMAGGLSVQIDNSTSGPPSNSFSAGTIDWQGQRLWNVSTESPPRIWETNLSTLTARPILEILAGATRGIAFIPNVGILYVNQGPPSSTLPFFKIDADTGSVIGSYETGTLGNTTTRVSVIGTAPVQRFVPLQVRGVSGLRSFLLISPNAFEAGGYCIDADTMEYVWGSTATGHPRLFQPGNDGSWVVGEQREGATDAYFLASRTGFVEVWRVTVTSTAAGILSGPGIGGTVGVTATRLPNLTAAMLGHAAGVISVYQATFDREDGAFVLRVADRAGPAELVDISRGKPSLRHHWLIAQHQQPEAVKLLAVTNRLHDAAPDTVALEGAASGAYRRQFATGKPAIRAGPERGAAEDRAGRHCSRRRLSPGRSYLMFQTAPTRRTRCRARQ